MTIKSQNGNCYDIYTIGMKKQLIYCKDTKDRRKHRTLGIYDSIERAGEVFREIGKSVSGYYEMPER